MKELHILKEITYEEAEKLFTHEDDIEEVMDAFVTETVNYIRFDLVRVLVNNGYLG